VKLLKRLLEFKSLLLFLIKCTEKAAMMNWRTGSWAEKDRDCPSTPVRADQGTRSGLDRRRRGPWPSVQKNPRRTFRGFWTHSAFLKQHHQPLQAEVAPWPKGPRPKTPPPSISMHPASMLTLDQRSSTWKPEISRFYPEICGPTNWPLSLSEDTDTWLPKEFLIDQRGASECA